jgi:hypothetical protein
MFSQTTFTHLKPPPAPFIRPTARPSRPMHHTIRPFSPKIRFRNWKQGSGFEGGNLEKTRPSNFDRFHWLV